MKARRQYGFSLVEVLVSMAIISIGAAALSKGFALQMATNNNSQIRAGAVMAVDRVVDRLRTEDPAAMPASGTDPAEDVAIDNTTYQVYVTYCSPSTYCTSNSVRALHVVAKFRGVSQYAMDTVYVQLR